MSVTITAPELTAAIRVGDSTEETAEVTRLLSYATVAVEHHAPDAPDVVHNEATVRLAGYYFDSPNAGSRTNYANAMRNSGAGRILLPYRVHRAGNVSACAATTQPGGIV